MASLQHRIAGALVMAAIFVAGGVPAFAQRTADKTPPDNTRVNKQDRQPGAVTADQQKENRSDREVTSEIRRAITKDKEMSTYAKNVKVVAQNGKVTLKGPVRSEDEKKAIEAKAAEVAGESNVDSQIRVAPKR
jgi:hyperosmotically inducible periplasmic protein